MMLLDVNILVHAHRQDTEKHGEIKAWMESALAQTSGVAVSELVLSGCLRVITHPKVFKEPTPLKQALEFLDDFRVRERVYLLSPGPDYWKIFTELCRDGEVRGNLVPDAYHAALAVEFGCEWITFDRGSAGFLG